MSKQYSDKEFLELKQLVQEHASRIDQLQQKLKGLDDRVWRDSAEAGASLSVIVKPLFNEAGIELRELMAYPSCGNKEEGELRKEGWQYMGRTENRIYMCRKKQENNG